MKKLLFLFFIFISVSLWSKTPESEIQKPISDNGEDYVIIYQYFVGPDPLANSDYDRSKQYLNKTLTIFDNAELKGTPILTISPQEVKHEGVQYAFKDSFLGTCNPGCEKYKFIPLDFIRIFYSTVSIAIKDLKEGVARVEHKNKSYYFKLNINDTQEYIWRDYKVRKNVMKILENDSSYGSFITDIKKCIAKKDFKCLETFLDNEKIDIEKETKKRAIYDDKALCDKLQAIRNSRDLDVYNVPEDMLNDVKNLNNFWSKINKVISYEGQEKFENLEVKNFGEVVLYEIQITLPNEICDNWLDVSIKMYKQNNKWKIISFRMSAFQH